MMIHGEPKIAVIKTNKDNSKAVYEISGLENGIADAYTSALRMMLLTHVPGIKPIGFNMMGIKNSQDRPSLIEQPIKEVIRNLEKIVVKPETEGQYQEIYEISFDGEVEGDLTLSMFSFENLVPVNKDLVILTSSEKHHVKIDVTLTLSSGYVVDSEKLQIGKNIYESKDGFIRMDSNFNPVLSTNFKTLENYPIEDKDSLILEVKTNGSVTSKTAIAIASKLLIGYLQPLAKLNTLNWEEIDKSPIAKNVKDEYDLPIEYLRFTPEQFNEMKAAGIVAIRDLRESENTYSESTREAIKRELEKVKLIDIEDF